MTGVTEDELQRHVDDFLARLSIEMLVTGNMHKDVRIFSLATEVIVIKHEFRKPLVYQRWRRTF